MDGLITRAPTRPPPLPPWVGRRPIDVTEYHRMVETGVLHHEERLELIEGELIRMAPMSGPHIGTIMALNPLVMPLLTGRAVISIQSSVRLDDYNEPQPDVAVLRPRADRYRGGLPPLGADVLLLMEVAVTTLRYDREVKGPLYARHGIPEYWIVDVEGAAVEIHRDPKPEGYADVRTARTDETLTVPTLPDARVTVAEILD